MSFGLFDFDHDTGELRRDGAAVKLAPQPARVLGLLLSRSGELVPRDDIRRDLWGDDTFVDFERGLNFCITQVRSALGDSSENPRFIQTVPRRGYRFIAPVTETRTVPGAGTTGAVAGAGTVPLLGDSPLAQPPSPEPGTGVGGWGRRSWIAAAVVAGIAAVIWWGWTERPAPQPAEARAGGAAVRVAVLPLLNLTGDASLNDLADGLTDEVITQLGTAAGDRLAVISRTSAMAYRDSGKSLADIARELDVSYVLEGAMRREGDALRVNGRLIAVSTQAAIAQFEEMLDRTSTALATQETHASIRIARNVASELLPAPPTTAETRPAVTSAAAWDSFLQANAAMTRGTPSDIRRAVAGFEDTVSRDPQFAAAWARLAEAQHLLAMMGVAPPADTYPAAQLAAQQAMRAAPDQANAHLANGLVHLWYNWRPADAAASFERALALNPSLAAAHHDYAWALVALGRQDDAIRHITRARDLDPLSTRANNDVGWLFLHLRQPQEATRACQHTLALDAGSLEAQACLERSYAQRQLFAAAFQAARATLPTPDAQQLFGNDTGSKGLREIWTWRLRQLEQASATRWINPYTLAVLYALTDNPTRALDALDDAYAKRVGMMVLLARDPAMDPLRGHPRFVALLQKISAPSS